jgi:hypothetical protein
VSEHKFFSALRRNLKGKAYYLKLNVRFHKGVADAWISGSKSDLWLEGKYLARLPPVVDLKKLLSAHQDEWLRGRHKEGRNVAVVLATPQGNLYFPGLSWEEPQERALLLPKLLKNSEFAHFVVKLVGAL